MTNAEYETRIAASGWPELRTLYRQIASRDTPDWPAGKAFEYLIIRAFELDGAKVRWPYEVELEGEIVEQIDGAIAVDGLYCLVESKDLRDPLSVAPLAKLRNQLLRRPPATVGLIFSTSGYTLPAQILASFLGGQTILLWGSEEIALAVGKERIVPLLAAKYRFCVETGVHNANTLEMGVLP